MARRLLLLFAAYLALLAGVSTSALAAAPANPAPGAQNCVGAFLSAAPSCAPADCQQSPCTRPGSIAGLARIAAGCCVATKAGRGLTDGERVGIVREAFQRKGNFGVGSATRADADQLGRDFVGPGFARSRSNPDILISADGLRKYRPPSFKPNRAGYQANLERRFEPGGRFNSNAHIDILDP